MTDAYIPRPLFPFYSPTRKTFESVDEVKTELKRLDPKAELPPSWQRRLVDFSRAARKLPYEVPSEYREAIRTYQNIHYRPENRDPGPEQEARKEATAEGAVLARQFLPAGARIDGKTLPVDHAPTFPLPILWESSRIKKESSDSIFAILRSSRSHRTQNEPARDL
ncbi:hypothetical protein [Verrucomicrobium sp. 3C]|uniref:hypothetical protein n=1 Tax=Verrucomicrobium sp. 3C TaxID=1134055 RepID=UPI00035E9C6E|nr:hypothetical protein [Verrucomicrobium sp. 3C]